MEVACHKCGTKGNVDPLTRWSHQNMRIAGAITVAAVKCGKCSTVFMTSFPQEVVYSHEEVGNQ